MLHKISFFILLFSSFFSQGYPQNHLNEGDFDILPPGGDCFNWHTGEQFEDNYNYWETDYANKAKYRSDWNHLIYRFRDCPTNCDCCNYHSPDVEVLNNGNGTYDIYAGIGEYEVLQQKLTDNNEFEEGKHYRVDFKIMVPEEYNMGVNLITGDSKIKFMLAKNKIKYKDPGFEFGSEPIEDICDLVGTASGTMPNDYTQYKSNDILYLDDFYLDEYTMDIWHYESFIFTMPDQGLNKHNWFAIDGESYAYAYIDDIEIYEVDYCNVDDLCSPIDGDIYPTVPHQTNPAYSNYAVTQLENVYSATNIRITQNGGAVYYLPDRTCVNGIKEVSWAGKTPGGSPVAAGWYAWEMTLENDCGPYEYTAIFVMPDEHYLPGADETVPCNNSAQAPILCCEDNPDIVIENETIYGEAELVFHATDKITVINTSVEPDAQNLLLKAGQEIELLPGTDIKEGANADIFLEACNLALNTSRLSNPEDELNADTCTDKQNEPVEVESSVEKEKPEPTGSPVVVLNPNPNSGDFYLSITYPNQQDKVEIEITSLSGNTVFRKVMNNFSIGEIHISLQKYPSGVYVVKVQHDTGVATRKVLIQ